MKRFITLLSVALITWSFQLDEPKVILPGNKKVSGKHIKATSSKWKVSAIQDGKENDRGIWTDRIEIVDFNRVRCIKRSQVFVAPDGKQLQNFTSIMNHASMIPYYNDAVLPDGTLSIREFDGNSVTVIEKTNGVEKRREVNKLEESVFDFYGGNFGILLTGFPLEKGAKFRFPSDNHDPTTGKEIVQWVEFSVKDIEEISLPGKGKIEVYRVEADLPNAYWTFWLSKKVSPYLCMLKLQRKTGITTQWTLIPD